MKKKHHPAPPKVTKEVAIAMAKGFAQAQIFLTCEAHDIDDEERDALLQKYK